MRRRPPARAAALVAAVSLAFVAAACAAVPAPESVAAQQAAATAAAAARTEAEQSDREAREEAAEKRTPVREKIVVVDRGGSSKTPTPGELAAASRAERERHGDRSVDALTDENLAAYAARGRVTISGTPVPEAGEETARGEGDEAVVGEAADAVCDEACWRRRARDLRQGWRDTVDSIASLEAEVADQRWRFYAEDDPWVRDAQVKPAWDRALDRLRTAREEAARYAERVEDLVEAGRRVGALPGWLREGIELEPDPAAARGADRDPAEPIEPPIADEQSREPRQD